MLRKQSESGWWLIMHPDHARLAGEFAAAWGNAHFRRPEPRERVLHGIASHDDGWALRDAHPKITREGKPSAFSIELVGKYSAFEEIDLAEYLAVRERAVRIIAENDAYAGLLIAMHTCSLLAEHTDRSALAPGGQIVLDAFLDRQLAYQDDLRAIIAQDASLTPEQRSVETILEHFRLLQACDNLSLLTCVAYPSQAHLLHPLPLNGGGTAEVKVHPVGSRAFRLAPWPFEPAQLRFTFPARHVSGHTFAASADLEAALHAAPVELLQVELTS